MMCANSGTFIVSGIVVQEERERERKSILYYLSLDTVGINDIFMAAMLFT